MRIIKLNQDRLAIPDSMSTKDLQAFIGFLATMHLVEEHYMYGLGSPLYSAEGYPSVRIQDLDLLPHDEAKAQSEASYAEYQAKREAAKTAT